EIDIFATSEFRMETGADLEQTCDSTPERYPTPLSARWMRQRILSRVLLPAPLRPMIPNTSPRSTDVDDITDEITGLAILQTVIRRPVRCQASLLVSRTCKKLLGGSQIGQPGAAWRHISRPHRLEAEILQGPELLDPIT